MNARTRTAYVGLGSNLGDSAGIVRAAFTPLRELGAGFRNSDLYLTQPWGVTDQPAYINAVARFDTDLDAVPLLAALHAIEERFGRTREQRWGPRTLDLDLLLLGEVDIDTPEITVPHPRLRERAFVLEPLAEIGPDVRVPHDGVAVRTLLNRVAAAERASVIRLTRTAELVPPPRVDYDAPGGAGEQYDDLRPFSPFDRAALAAVIEAVGPLDGRRVLDVGCGTGRFTRRLAEAGGVVTGLDASEKMLSRAVSQGAVDVDRRPPRPSPVDHEGRPLPSHAGDKRRPLPKPVAHRLPRYVLGDAGAALPDGPFDAITAFYCIQYFDANAFAKHVAAALAPGGTVAIATFPHDHFAQTEFARYFPSLPSIDMARFPSVPALQDALGAAGLAAIETRDVVLALHDDPAALIGRVERKYLSSFFLLPPAEFERGLAQMRRDWNGRRTVPRTARGVIVSARRPDGR